jgi:transposase
MLPRPGTAERCWGGRPPTASAVPDCGFVATTVKGSRPMTIIRIGLDTSKHIFQLHGVDEREQPVLRRQLRRGEIEKFFAKLPATRVGLEACGAAHHWARVLRGFGHEAVLLPPQYIKPYVKRGKNDAIDAAAICEAMSRPGMRFVPVKSKEDQAALMLLKVRDLLVKQRTMLGNALRGHAAEFGVAGAKGPTKMAALLQQIAEDADLPALAREMLGSVAAQLAAVEMRLAGIEAKLVARYKADPKSRLLATIPGVGRLGAVSFALKVPDATVFRSGRHFAAWLGITPREHSTAGRQRLGKISRQGDEDLRRLLVLGATAVIQQVVRRAEAADPRRRGSASPWLLQLLARKPKKLATIALANKMARIVWAMLVSGEVYRRPTMAS